MTQGKMPHELRLRFVIRIGNVPFAPVSLPHCPAMNLRFFLIVATFLAFSCGFPPSATAQLRRPGIVTVDREDRTKSELVKEDGAIYLEGMVDGEMSIRITAAAPVYVNLKGERWMGNLLPEQNGVLLAVSDKAYRVRAKAKQGQVAGWISKAAVKGIPEGFEENLRLYHERYLIVSELIENKQIALGMTVAEVTAALGPPDKRQSTLTNEGRSDSLEFISYQRVPQTVMSVDAFGQPVPVTRYLEVESGRISVAFSNDVVTSISESEGLNFSNARLDVTVPPLVFLF